MGVPLPTTVATGFAAPFTDWHAVPRPHRNSSNNKQTTATSLMPDNLNLQHTQPSLQRVAQAQTQRSVHTRILLRNEARHVLQNNSIVILEAQAQRITRQADQEVLQV